MKKAFLLMFLTAFSMSFATRIGVLKKDSNTKCREEIVIDMDVEDSNNDTKVVSGSKTLPGISLGGHAVFTYCVLNVETAPSSPFDYAVLSLDRSCPSGSYRYIRHHDNEDSHNANSYKGNISPNVVDHNATLYYCFVPKASKSTRKYPFDAGYGVFANTSSKYISHSEIKIDDQDDHDYFSFFSASVSYTTDAGSTGGQGKFDKDYDYIIKNRPNVNYWNYMGIPLSIESRINPIMNGTVNTIYHVVKWVGSSSAILAKKSSVDADVDLANNNLAAANKSAMVSVKAMDRNSISFDLETSGDVQITVMGINGAVFAKISKENMMPGAYSINWNSASVPNGRYVVAVQQNGKVSAKNVILK